jgi:membrane fusion protein, multidrug efflux system
MIKAATCRLVFTFTALVVLSTLAAGCTTGSQPEANLLPPNTAEVTRTTLVEVRTMPGDLGYGELSPINAAGLGTLTWIAPIGSTVARGEPLFKIDERPVAALYGAVPMYRTLDIGAQGADVHQLQENLAELGYTGFKIDGYYTTATASAVRAWQTDLGLPGTGIVEPGEVIFIPGPIRIAGHTSRVGDALRGAQVLSYTGLDRHVTVQLRMSDRALAIEGQAVTVTVPGIGSVEGEISSVSTVLIAPGASGAASPGSSSSAGSEASIEVIVTIHEQDALGSLDAAPVDVVFVTEAREDVLVVPIAALLALAEGGYGVELVEGNLTRIVAVSTGMFAAGRVEVSGEAIAEGVMVGVPR